MVWTQTTKGKIKTTQKKTHKNTIKRTQQNIPWITMYRERTVERESARVEGHHRG